ncbi:ubiquinone/menaquinone biosynthesis methyltransferase UbiE [gamma proteobacterium HTCC5015]|nr:ubiquinone/menaquinone biosynthesis methyltransferase UbiE [gamma proteobacterium HTCC5015]
MKKTTHFGYQQVDANEKAGRVAEVFHSVASKYDVMNDFMSMGIHRLWKRYTIDISGVRPGHKVLDLAGGTGDLAKAFSKKVGATGEVVLSDINASMLSEGRSRMLDAGVANNMRFVQANAEALPFPDNTFNCVTMAFGLRNVTDKDAALRSIYRVLKPGGRLLVLEFSRPTNSLFRKIYDEYSFRVIPKVGEAVTGDRDSYQYLVESIRMHPDQDTLKGMMEEAGFDRSDYINLTNGVVAIHRGFKL